MRTVPGQAICTTSSRFWNSVEFPYGWLQIFVAIRRLKRAREIPTEKKEDIRSALRHRLGFSPIENQAGERVGAVNRFRLTSHRPATPIV